MHYGETYEDRHPDRKEVFAQIQIFYTFRAGIESGIAGV